MTATARVRTLVTSRAMWAALGVALVVLLVIGANHPTPLTPADRIANLENIIKCPSCASASLTQSETVGANDLKTTIGAWVHEGLSDQVIESRIVAEYGTSELLRPTNSALWIVPTMVVAIAIISIVGFLVRRRRTQTPAAPADLALVQRLLGEREQSREPGT